MKFPLSLAAAVARMLPAPLKKAIYRSGPLARFIRRTLNRAAPSGLSQAQVAAGGLQGATLLLDLQTEKDYWLGTYEPELQDAVQRWVKPGMVIYDIGANIGYISLLLARACVPGGQVIAFEPLPANLERLRQNLALNPHAPVSVVAAAVTDRPGKARFLAHASGAMGKAAGSAGRKDENYPTEIEVDAVSLDAAAYAQTSAVPLPQLVKMDIEGGEVLALPGMRRLLREARPMIFLELHGPEAAQAAWQELTAAGYAVLRMQPGYPRAASLSELDWKAYVVGKPLEG